MKQLTNAVLMVRPAGFRMNEQTAVNNYFQEDLELKNAQINARAQEEFDGLVTVLRQHGVNVLVAPDNPDTDTPDALFPNNWISTHEDGTVGIYPMFAENRRKERREDILDFLEEKGFVVNHVMDYSAAEEEGVFLEGTGSVVLDRVNRKAYCALSARADEDLFIEFCEDFEYDPVLFTAYQSVEGKRRPIYHTNVMMCVGNSFAVVCLDAVDDKQERKNLVAHLKSSGKEIIALTEEQIHHFAGNMLQLEGLGQKSLLAMSTTAYDSLTTLQRNALEKHATLVHSAIPTIEICGGGSVRCMLAEIFLPKQ